MATRVIRDEKLKRSHRQTFTLNEKEYSAMLQYIKKYRIQNKSKFIRETLFASILKKFDRDYPSLFDNHCN